MKLNRILAFCLLLIFSQLFAGKKTDLKKLVPFLSPSFKDATIKEVVSSNLITDKVVLVIEKDNNEKSIFEVKYKEFFQNKKCKFEKKILFLKEGKEGLYKQTCCMKGDFHFLITEKEYEHSTMVCIHNLTGTNEKSVTWYKKTKEDRLVYISPKYGYFLGKAFGASPDGNYFVYTSIKEKKTEETTEENKTFTFKVTLLDQKKGLLNFLKVKQDPSRLAFSDDSNWLLIEGSDHTCILDLKRDEIIKVIEHTNLQFVPYNKYFLYNEKILISLDQKYDVTETTVDETILAIDNKFNTLCLINKKLYLKIQDVLYAIFDPGENHIKNPSYVGFTGKNDFVVFLKNSNQIFFYKKPKK